jgi:hypothetical protein
MKPKLIPALILLTFACTLAPAAAASPVNSSPPATIENPNSIPISNPSSPTNPILFVTQIPIPADFTTIGSTFGNHLSGMQEVGRGGDLWIRYPDGTLKNLTEAAGYGHAGFQDDESIAVRQPAVHWDGQKAIFSMVIGAPEQQYQWEDYYWQLYEITGLGKNDTPVITKVPNQPANYNNVSPIYGANDRILFTSDRPFNGAAHLYPQLDEYEEAPVVSGIWSLDPATGDLRLLDHAPSGDFTPTIDSFGRVIFTRWDHLQRDQQADADNYAALNGEPCVYCTFNWSSEAPNAIPLYGVRTEVFPEPRAEHELIGTNLWGHTINQFFPWMMLEDGTELETLNHIGRHELVGYIPPSFTDDPNLVEFYDPSGMFNEYRITNMFHIREDPANPGIYYAVDAPEFSTHTSGMIFTLNANPSTDADHMAVTYITHPDTASYTPNPSPNHSGLYRNPLPLTNGTLLVIHTPETDEDDNIGTYANPQSKYDLRLKTMVFNGTYWEAGTSLTGGISKTVTYWDPDTLISYSGELWELDPVEVVARPRPNPQPPGLPAPENQIFLEVGVAPAALQAYLKANGLALVISRDVTTRDDNDEQQPFNLSIPGGVQTIGAGGKIYTISYLQFFQADLLRSLDYGGTQNPSEGRRVLAQEMHAPNVSNPPTTGPAGSVILATDGSMAAFVPALRAMTWQLTDSAGAGVVRERYWLTFQPGEIRVCTSCHGLNEFDQAGAPYPTNPPEALRTLLEWWKSLQNLQPQAYLPLVTDN